MGELLCLLRTEYGLRRDRRAAYAALDKRRAVGCHILEYQDDGEGYRRLSRPLELSEIRLLSDAASVFSGSSLRQCERLLKKLGQGLSRWRREQCRPLVMGASWRGRNQEAFLSVEVLRRSYPAAVRCSSSTWNTVWTSGSIPAGKFFKIHYGVYEGATALVQPKKC